MGDEAKVAVGGAAGAPTLEQLQALALRNGWYEGVPVPVTGLNLVLEDRHPLRWALAVDPGGPDRTVRACSVGDVREDVHLRNQWTGESPRYAGRRIALYQVGARVVALTQVENQTATMLFHTLEASAAWSLEAEERALGKLRALVRPHVYEQYFLTGTFLETSARSGLTYMFRRLRPTVALRASESGTRIIAALCLHPLGFYEGSWAGTMVPTDDVIAHLIFMRGDEAGFWRRANQHPPHDRLAGIF